jgi:hypothetical protein
MLWQRNWRQAVQLHEVNLEKYRSVVPGQAVTCGTRLCLSIASKLDSRLRGNDGDIWASSTNRHCN